MFDRIVRFGPGGLAEVVDSWFAAGAVKVGLVSKFVTGLNGTVMDGCVSQPDKTSRCPFMENDSSVPSLGCGRHLSNASPNLFMC